MTIYIPIMGSILLASIDIVENDSQKLNLITWKLWVWREIGSWTPLTMTTGYSVITVIMPKAWKWPFSSLHIMFPNVCFLPTLKNINSFRKLSFHVFPETHIHKIFFVFVYCVFFFHGCGFLYVLALKSLY